MNDRVGKGDQVAEIRFMKTYSQVEQRVYQEARVLEEAKDAELVKNVQSSNHRLIVRNQDSDSNGKAA